MLRKFYRGMDREWKKVTLLLFAASTAVEARWSSTNQECQSRLVWTECALESYIGYVLSGAIREGGLQKEEDDAASCCVVDGEMSAGSCRGALEGLASEGWKILLSECVSEVSE